MSDQPAVIVEDLWKTFTLHHQGGVQIPVLRGISFEVCAGECVILDGPSGAGKSTVLRSIYANYLPQAGKVGIRHRGEMVDLLRLALHEVLAVRRETLGYVSQFLRVVPRVSTIEVVREPMMAIGVPEPEATERARAMLERLRIPERLWSVAPATFSGGEQQRVNIARTFAVRFPILLLDEPTASLDVTNQATVIALIAEARAGGSALVGIFHDPAVREAVASRTLRLNPVREAA
jgi:alpha-D-ribose 1-methylphosphonate 5-triphosphate synthase subunit PhnL